LNFCEEFDPPPSIPLAPQTFKCPELPVLQDYTRIPEDYWKLFPSRPLPDKIVPRVNVDKLNELVEQNKNSLTGAQIQRAKTVVDNLVNGAPAFQKSELPACVVKNAENTKKFGREIADSIAHWIKEGFACGPFDQPPIDRIRVNSLLAVPQDGKVRPVLNVSLPENLSFNSNIDPNAMEKVKMSSAKEFGFIVKKCGRFAVMSKSDLKDAYKNIFAKLKDLRLQAFEFGGKYFIDLTQIFGARPAVCNFDQSGHTVKDLSVIVSTIPPEIVVRHLDDTPCVSPAHKSFCSQFSLTYKKICKDLNLKVAQDCEKFEKAFTNSTYGKVLGLWFDTEKLCWSLPKDKKAETLQLIHEAIVNEFLPLLTVQKLAGKLNAACQLCPFLSLFRIHLYSGIGYAVKNNLDAVKITAEAKNDLKVCAGFLLDKDEWYPIPTEPCAPPLSYKTFVSDAAGLSAKEYDSGVASIGIDENDKIFFAARHWWDQSMLYKERSSPDDLSGKNSCFLEFVGILLPFLLIPQKLKNQHIVCKVDNSACIFGWYDKKMPGDSIVSILIRSLYLISFYLASIVHVVHLPRLSTWEACLVDRLSRHSTTENADRFILSNHDGGSVPVFMYEWLRNPTEDWSLPYKILSYVKNRVNKYHCIVFSSYFIFGIFLH